MILLCLFATTEARAVACRPFRVHMRASLPSPPPESATLKECIEHYTKMDLDRDGIADWTNIVDGQSSDVLYPNDDDMDGDGIENVLDPDPLDAKIPGKKSGASALVREVPAHLVLDGGANLPLSRLQSLLYKKYGILAIDHTDHHSPGVLRALLLLLEKGLPAGLSRDVASVRYVYAFQGHDSVVNIAAYHRAAKAISLGGAATYGEKDLSAPDQVRVVAALAHEIGHAFLFDRIPARALSEIGARYGGWKSALGREAPGDLFDKAFFNPHPMRKELKLPSLSLASRHEFVSRQALIDTSLASQYAATNIHEWFADAFAALALARLGEQGALGPDWKARLVRLPDRSNGYWTNYNNLSPSFRGWLEARLAPGKDLKN